MLLGILIHKYPCLYGVVVFHISFSSYRKVQLHLTPEIEVFYMSFERCHNVLKIERDPSNNM